MEPNTIPQPQNTPIKIPLALRIITTLDIILSFLIILLSFVLLYLMNGSVNPIILYGFVFAFVINALTIVICVGLRRLRAWALYAYAILNAISIGLSVSEESFTSDTLAIVEVGLQLLFIVYLWSIKSLFIRK